MRERKERRLADLCQACRERGLILTSQRLAVLRALVDLDDHPTADRVHEALLRRRLRASRATVFRALEGLAALGIVTKACHPGASARYDPRTDLHHHLVCMRCERVIDFNDRRLDALPVPDTRRFGFRVADLRVQVRGTCRQCRDKEDRR